MFLELLACGPVTLGDAAVGTPSAGLFESTVPRSITWHNDQAVEDADNPGVPPPPPDTEDVRRPTLVLGVFPQFGEMSSTHTGIASGWVISGDLIFTTGVVTSCEFHAQNVKVVGTVDGSADLGIRNCYIYRCKFEEIAWDNANFQVVESTEFDGPTVLATYGRLVHCEIDGGFTIGAFAPALPPGGMFGCDFAGTFTGPAASLQLDAATNFFFVGNGAALAGGATKVFMHDLTP